MFKKILLHSAICLTTLTLISCGGKDGSLSVTHVKTPSFEIQSQLPTPPQGYRWQYVDNMSDEFNGSSLDSTKWLDHIPTWKGRPPARFLKDNVTVIDGNLKLKTSTYKGDNEGYTMGGAAVSGKHAATYGYYEARLKASKTKMSTTFWLHSDRADVVGSACDESHSIEIDILEAIGGWPQRVWTDVMHSNTHYKGRELVDGKCKRAKYISEGVKHDTGVNMSDDYHTYAAWWVTPNQVKFYFDNKLTGTVDLDNPKDAAPFNSEMSLRMVVETYYWQTKLINSVEGDDEPYPTPKELDDSSINTAYYDYVRSFKLVPTAP
jgi:hypothetical protein